MRMFAVSHVCLLSVQYCGGEPVILGVFSCPLAAQLWAQHHYHIPAEWGINPHPVAHEVGQRHWYYGQEDEDYYIDEMEVNPR